MARISKRFEKIEHQSQNREFIAHTGTLRGVRITALATGIGTDNLDIDGRARCAGEHRPGEAHAESAATLVDHRAHGHLRCAAGRHSVDNFIVSHSGLGLDNVLHYYAHENTDNELRLLQAILDHTAGPAICPAPTSPSVTRTW